MHVNYNYIKFKSIFNEVNFYNQSTYLGTFNKISHGPRIYHVFICIYIYTYFPDYLSFSRFKMFLLLIG